MGCAPPPPPPPPAPEPLAAVPEDGEATRIPEAPAPLLRGTPVTVSEMLGSLRISREGSLGTIPVF